MNSTTIAISNQQKIERLESDLRAARAEIERLRGYGTLDIDKLIADRTELTALRRQIDGAAEITAEYFGDFVCWTPTFDEPTELKLNMQPGETRTFKLLEVKP